MMKQNKFFPLFVSLSGKKIVVVGGGKIATRRIQTLLPFCDGITVIAPEITEELKPLAEEGSVLHWHKKAYEREDILDADLVLACTDSKDLNDGIAAVCRCLGITVNHCGDKTKCDFYFPGVAACGSLVVGVTAGGTDHKKARKLTEKIREMLSGEWREAEDAE